MAYYLDNSSHNTGVSLPTEFSPDDLNNWIVEISLRTGADVNTDVFVIGKEGGSNNRAFKIFINSGRFGCIFASNWAGGGFIEYPPTIATNTDYKIKVEVVNGTVTIFVDEGAGYVAGESGNRNTSGRNPVAAISKGNTFGGSKGYIGRFYWASLTDTTNSAKSRFFDASASGGTGSILIDTGAAGQDGLLNSAYPTDDSQWVFYSDTTALELTPTVINSNSQSFNPTLQYASLLSIVPGVVNSTSSSLNPSIQYSASLLLAPATVNSNASALNPNISFSATLSLFPTAVNSTSSSLDPIVNYTSVLNISPSVINSDSATLNPSIDYTSALIISPVTVDSSSVSLDPLVEYKAVINITSQLINSASVSLNPFISTGATQDVGLVSAGFADDLYSVKYQLSNITVNFKG